MYDNDQSLRSMHLHQAARPRPRARPLKPVVQRAFRLLRDPQRVGVRLSVHQQRRIRCMLLRLLRSGGDDRFITAQSVLSYRNLTYKKRPDFSRVSRWLTFPPTSFAPEVSDREFLRKLVNIDQMIIDGRHKINQLYAQMGSTVHVRVRQLRDWVAARQRDPKSIYHCYRGGR